MVAGEILWSLFLLARYKVLKYIRCVAFSASVRLVGLPLSAKPAIRYQ